MTRVQAAAANTEESESAKEIDAVSTKEGEAPTTNLLPPEGWEEDALSIDAGYSENSTGDPYPVVESEPSQNFWQTQALWMEQPWFWPVVAALVVWSVLWKGFALWHAARNGQRNWFIALLVVNTVGILEMVYLKWGQRKAK